MATSPSHNDPAQLLMRQSAPAPRANGAVDKQLGEQQPEVHLASLRHSQEFEENKIMQEYEYRTADHRELMDFQNQLSPDYEAAHHRRDSSSHQQEGLTSM